MQISKDNLPKDKVIYANYKDEYNDLQISFIVTNVISEDSNTFITTKNDQVRTAKGFFQTVFLTGTNQINVKYLHNIHE